MPDKRDKQVSRRGVYYDLSVSPYVVQTAYGDSFRFSSLKRQQMYERDVAGELDKLHKIMQRNDMQGFLPEEIVQLLERAVTKALYNSIEGKRQ